MNSPVLDEYGDQCWYNSVGNLHRVDGPAYIGADGHRSYLINGNIHREDGPAIIHADGSQEWWVSGKRHRTDGPSYIDTNGYQEWSINGKEISSNKEFQKTANLSDEEMTVMILKYGDVK